MAPRLRGAGSLTVGLPLRGVWHFRGFGFTLFRRRVHAHMVVEQVVELVETLPKHTRKRPLTGTDCEPLGSFKNKNVKFL